MKYLTLILALGMCSCSTSEEDPEDKNDPDKKNISIKKQIIGRIASVSSTGGFVLIQKYSAGKMPVNTIIQTSGPDGRTASLKPSGERVRNFFAADIVNGEVQIGDAVVAYFDQPKKKDTPPAEDEDKSEKEDESARFPPGKDDSKPSDNKIKT
jgi:hypothetical protein